MDKYEFNKLVIAETQHFGVQNRSAYDDERLSPCKSSWALAHGMCFFYAYLFQQTFGGQIVSYSTQTKYGREGHCFVKLNGLYFDSENIEGVSNWKKLQSYMKYGKDKNLTVHRNPESALTRNWYVQPNTLALIKQIAVRVKHDYALKSLLPSSQNEHRDLLVNSTQL